LAVKNKQHNFTLGSAGETTAVAYLRRAGYQIWETNFRAGNDEIDIIAFDPRFTELVFVEVKTRVSSDFGDPALAVDRRKLAAQVRVAAHYLQAHHSTHDFRFDIIAVLPDQVEHFENITWLE